LLGNDPLACTRKKRGSWDRSPQNPYLKPGGVGREISIKRQKKKGEYQDSGVILTMSGLG